MPAFPRTKPLPHTLSAYYPTICVASPATALSSAEQPQPPHILLKHIPVNIPHLNISVIHVIGTFYNVIQSVFIHHINPSFRLSRSIRPVILYCLTLHAFLLLYLADNSINLLRTGISFHTLQIVGFFLQ